MTRSINNLSVTHSNASISITKPRKCFSKRRKTPLQNFAKKVRTQYFIRPSTQITRPSIPQQEHQKEKEEDMTATGQRSRDRQGVGWAASPFTAKISRVGVLMKNMTNPLGKRRQQSSNFTHGKAQAAPLPLNPVWGIDPVSLSRWLSWLRHPHLL